MATKVMIFVAKRIINRLILRSEEKKQYALMCNGQSEPFIVDIKLTQSLITIRIYNYIREA